MAALAIPGKYMYKPVNDTATCTQCWDVNQSNWKDVDDDLLVCIKSSCDKKHRIMCRSCMKSSHKKKEPHTLDNDPNKFVDLDKWYDLLSIRKSEPDGTFMKASKATSMNTAKGAACLGLCVNPKWVKMAWKSFPKNMSTQQKALQIVKRINQSKITKNRLLSMIAKREVVINGLMFALEAGYDLVQYRYYGTISCDEFKRRLKKAGLAHGSAWIGAMIGAYVGFGFGPLGSFAGSVIGGAIADYTARECFESIVPNKRQKLIENALIRFGYGNEKLDTLLDKCDIFNKDELERRYHQQAIYHHPDGILSEANLSDKEKQNRWGEFYSMYDMLLLFVKQRDDKISKKNK